MQELEKILEEIIKKTFSVEIREYESETAVLLDDVEEILKKHMNDGWIPMEDRLPKDDVRVLVTYADIDDEQYTDIAITTYGYAYLGSNKLDFKEWRSPFKYFRSNYKVIAWRPLPEPLPARKER